MTSDQQPAASLSSDPPRLTPRRRYRPWVSRMLLFAACVVGVDALVGEQGFAERMRARRDLQRVSSELEVLRRLNQDLRRQASRLKYDLDSIEDLARRDLGFVRSGEVFVVLKDVPK